MEEKPVCQEKKDRFCFQEKKENTLCSLYEVEHFLCSFKKIVKGARIYKILKY